MTQEQIALEQCQELFDKEVVRIDLIPMSGSDMKVPFAVPFISEMKGSYPNPVDPTTHTLPANWDGAVFANSKLTLSRKSADQPDALIGDGMKMTPSVSREASGVTRKFSLQVPCIAGFTEIRAKESAVQNCGDFMVIATAHDGSQYLLYTLPNTSTFAIDDQVATAGTFAVKIELQSRSGVIRLTA